MQRLICIMLCALFILPAFAEDAPGARAIFETLQAGEYEAIYALFDQTMRSAMTADELAAILSQLEGAYGALKTIGAEETTPNGAYTLSSLPLSYEKGDLLFAICWLNGKLIGLFFYDYSAPKVASPDELPPSLLEEDASVGDPALPGTLTLPEDASSPLPAVVLLHGSGPNDRDESVGQTKLFRDLAWNLAQKGIAVLRYDKRTLTYGASITPEEMKTYTVKEEALDDAAAAARLLASDPRIDANRIYLIGHSMGAMLAPRAAMENPGLYAGLVLLSGTPKTLADIILSQNQALVDQMDLASQLVGRLQQQLLRKDWEDVRTGTAEDAQGKTLFGQPAYYFWEMARYDTGEMLQALDVPALIVNGGRDFQVTDADGIDAWRALELPENVRLSYYPDLNHLLMDPEAPEDVRGTKGEYSTPCHVSEEIINEITAFILN